jgi:hypothetical protein
MEMNPAGGVEFSSLTMPTRRTLTIGGRKIGAEHHR